MMLVLWFCWLLAGAFVFYKRKDSARLRNTLFLTGVFFMVCAAARALLLLTDSQLFSALSCSQTGAAFVEGLLVDSSVFALFCGPFLLLLNLPFSSLRWQKCVLGTAFFVVGLLVLALAGNLFYFRLVGRHTGADVWNLLTSFSLVWKVVCQDYKWALCLVIILTAAGTWSGVKRAVKSGVPRRGAWLWELLCLLFLAWILNGAWRGFAPSISPARIYSRGLEYGHLVQNGVFSMLYAVSPGWYVPHAKLRRGHPTFGELSFDEAAAETKELLLASKQETAADARFPFLRRRMSFNADARGRNLVILALESLDYAQVDALAGTSYGATPNLDALIRQGVSFENFYACGSGSSLDGIGTLMTGVCRLGGVDYFGRGMESFSISRLGKLFEDNGYNAFFARPAEDAWMFIGPLARLTGFKTAGGEDLQKHFQKKKVSDGEALTWLAQEMKSSDKPFVGFFFSLATHEPIGSFMPEHFDPETERKFPDNSYLRALAYTDWSVGRLVADLKASGLYDNTVFVIVGDHILRGRTRTGVSERYRVPFVITAPGVLAPGVSSRLGGQADVLPTLVDLFHITAPYAAMGNSVLDESAPPFAFISAECGAHFGLVSPEGVGWDDPALAAKKQINSPELRKKAVALNKAVYASLLDGKWAEK